MKKINWRVFNFSGFVFACFFAFLVFSQFSDSVILLIAAFLLLCVTSVLLSSFVLFRKQDSSKEEQKLFVDRLDESIRAVEKAVKANTLALKEQNDEMSDAFLTLSEKLEKQRKGQENAAKTLILYNKENARQLALNEQEEFRQLREILTDSLAAVEEATEKRVNGIKRLMSTHSKKEVTESQKNNEASITAFRDAAEQLSEIKENIRQLEPEPRSGNLNEITSLLNQVIRLLQEDRRRMSFEEPAIELNEPDDVKEESILSSDESADPSKETESRQPESMEDVSKEPEENPEKSKEITQEALDATGVDLSDPNKALSADDIAALFASLGK